MSELPELDLRDCFAVTCPERLPEPETATGTPASYCDPGERIPIGVSWKRVESGLRDCPGAGACKVIEADIVPTDGGRLWTFAEALDPDYEEYGYGKLGVWLALYDTDGRLLREQMPDLAGDQADEVNYGLSAAADGRGHLFLGVTKRTRGSSDGDSWLAEYDADGELLARRTLVPGIRLGPRLALAGADGLAVGKTDGAGGIALIGTDGTVRWTQNRVGTTELHALVSDASGRVTIGGRYRADAIVEQFDPRGDRIWSRRLDDGLGASLAADHQGGVLRTGLVQLETPVIAYILQVNKLDSSGGMVWRTEMPVSQPGGRLTTLVDVRGNILIPGTGAALGLLRANVHELSEDGTFCRAFEVDDASLASFARIATSASGHGLFFQETRNLSETEYELSFGRLAYSPR